jgi:hypothetical protein
MGDWIKLDSKKLVWIDPGLLQNRPERPSRHGSGMVRYGRIPLRRWVVSDLMTARRLPIEGEPVGFKLASDLAVTESCEPPTSSSYHNRVVVMVRSRRECQLIFPISPRLNEFAGNVPRDLQCFRNRPPLGHQPRQLL